MKSVFWQAKVAVPFLLISAGLYFAHYYVFRDAQFLFNDFLSQLGFLPISVFLVTVLIEALLARREKLAMLKKLNMVIGIFFSEVGTELIRNFAAGRARVFTAPDHLLVHEDWREADYAKATRNLAVLDQEIRPADIHWEKLQAFLRKEKSFLLGLLANPNLLEHESFTDLLWAVFHFAEELDHRKNVRSLGESDSDHLVGDIKRIYVLLGREWLAYMKHLQENYPYLFSLAIRTNPFNPNARAEIS